VNACRGSAIVEYMCTKFGVDSLSCCPFREQTETKTDPFKVAVLLITLHWLLLAWEVYPLIHTESSSGLTSSVLVVLQSSSFVCTAAELVSGF